MLTAVEGNSTTVIRRRKLLADEHSVSSSASSGGGGGGSSEDDSVSTGGGQGRTTVQNALTHGKYRPATDDEEFRWKYQYHNSNCRVLSHFNCALSGKILLQGRMTITTTAIGFYSVFNDSTFLSLIPTIILFEIGDIVKIS